MNEYLGQERRTTHRKELYAPIRLTAKESVISTGHVLNISYYGLKVEIMFKTTKDRPLMDEILSAPNIILEIGKAGDKIHLKVPVDVKWSTYRYGEGEKIYEAGFALRLSEEQKQEWHKFYEGLQDKRK